MPHLLPVSTAMTSPRASARTTRASPNHDVFFLEIGGLDEGGAIGEDPEQPHYQQKACNGA